MTLNRLQRSAFFSQSRYNAGLRIRASRPVQCRRGFLTSATEAPEIAFAFEYVPNDPLSRLLLILSINQY